jgi:hypothetical protein
VVFFNKIIEKTKQIIAIFLDLNFFDLPPLGVIK